MEFISVTDPAFKPYGRVVDGYDVSGILEALQKTPCPEGVTYVPEEESLQWARGAEALGVALFGGMPYEFGYCNGHNTRLNCLEYHRDSEFNLGTEDFVLLLARMDDIDDKGFLDTSCVKAFRVPAGVLVEVYATSLHYAPCHTDPDRGFRVLVALPMGTNTNWRPGPGPNAADNTLWARNKWLLAHPESAEAAEGAAVLLKGVNLDIASDL
jgi:hypothetical protein